jgi:hypothetical protein
MKSKLLITALIAAFSLPVFAQSTATAVDQVKQNNREIRQDNRDINKDKKEIAIDQKKIDHERKIGNVEQLAEDKDIKAGDLAGAQKMEKKREHTQHKINQEKRVLKHDKKDLNGDRKVRNAEVKERNQEAGAIK